MIIGIGFRKRSGKDVIARYLVERYGFRQTSFAKALKAACAQIFHLGDEYWNGDLKETPHPFWGTTPRDIMQRVGTEAMRQGFDNDIWVKSVQWEIEQAGPEVNFVISDVRFPNEADAIKLWGGIVWKVYRASVEPRPPSFWQHPIQRLRGTWEHASERAMKTYGKWDGLIDNNGTLDALYQEIELKMASRVLLDRSKAK